MSRPGRRSLADRLGLGLSLVSLVIGMSAVQLLQAAPPLDEPRHSPNGRLEAERLAAVQASVDSLAARRRNHSDSFSSRSPAGLSIKLMRMAVNEISGYVLSTVLAWALIHKYS